MEQPDGVVVIIKTLRQMYYVAMSLIAQLKSELLLSPTASINIRHLKASILAHKLNPR
jgi:hypothetical protein